MAASALERAARKATEEELHEWLETSPLVREWLSGGDPMDPDAGALVATKQAAVLLGVERTRVWKWERARRLARALTSGATPLFMRRDVLAVKAAEEQAVEEERLRRESVERAAAEQAAEAAAT